MERRRQGCEWPLLSSLGKYMLAKDKWRIRGARSPNTESCIIIKMVMVSISGTQSCQHSYGIIIICHPLGQICSKGTHLPFQPFSFGISSGYIRFSLQANIKMGGWSGDETTSHLFTCKSTYNLLINLGVRCGYAKYSRKAKVPQKIKIFI
jgi:hypothetical protein